MSEASAAANPSSLSSARWARRPPLASGAVIAHVISLVVALPVLLCITRTQWFFFDEWDFLTNRGFAGTSLQLFTPHNEHWSTIPILVYRALFSLFGLRTYTAYLVPLFLAHIVLAHLLWRVMLRLGVNTWLATGLSAVFLFLGAGWENLIWAFQIGFVGATTLGVWAMLLNDREELTWRRQVSIWAVLIAALMCSGIGVTMVAVTALVTLFRRGLRAAILTISIPAAAYVLWLAVAGRRGFGSIPVTSDSFLRIPTYLWTGLTAAVEGLTGFAGAGSILILGIVAWLFWLRHDSNANALVFAGCIGAVGFLIVNAVGRGALGSTEAAAPRYAYTTIALLLPGIAATLDLIARRDRLAQFAALALVGFFGCQGLAQLWTQARVNHVLRDQSKRQILAAADYLTQGLPVISKQPDPVLAPNLTVDELRELSARGDLPAEAGGSATDMLSARAALLTTLEAHPRYALGSSALEGVAGAVLSTGANSCVELQSVGGAPMSFRLNVGRPSSISMESPLQETIQYFLQPGDGDEKIANPLSLQMPAGKVMYLNIDDSNVHPFIVVPPGGLQVCGVNH